MLTTDTDVAQAALNLAVRFGNMNAFVGVMACGHPLRRPLQGRLVHARPFPFGEVDVVDHVLCRTSSPQMWFASALAGFGVYVCVRVYVCCPPPLPSVDRSLFLPPDVDTHTHTHTHPAGVRQVTASWAKSQDLVPFVSSTPWNNL